MIYRGGVFFLPVNKGLTLQITVQSYDSFVQPFCTEKYFL